MHGLKWPIKFTRIVGTIALQQLVFCLNGELLQVQGLLCLLARDIRQLLLVLGVECQALDLHRLAFLQIIRSLETMHD